MKKMDEMELHIQLRAMRRAWLVDVLVLWAVMVVVLVLLGALLLRLTGM